VRRLVVIHGVNDSLVRRLVVIHGVNDSLVWRLVVIHGVNDSLMWRLEVLSLAYGGDHYNYKTHRHPPQSIPFLV
jgi:hypothetical protein